MKNIIVTLLISSLLSIIYAQDFYDVDEFASDYMANNHVPGLACALVKNGQISWSGSYGMANVEKEIPMSVNGIMNIASITKTITATAVMQLWERGEIDLDEDISTYLPGAIRNPHFPHAPITVKQLLTHTSSLIDGSAYYNSYSCGDPEISLREWMLNYMYTGGRFYNEEENFLLKGPGEQDEYSNVGYGLLGFIVEEVSGISFSEYCFLNIFEPLGMNKSGFYLHDLDLSNHIKPYFYVSEESREVLMNEYSSFFPDKEEFAIGKFSAPCLYSFPNYPDGLLRTSVEDLSHFLIAYMKGGKYKGATILKESTIDKMLTLQLEGNPSQGLCWHLSGFESLWGHGGNDPGVNTKMFFSPDTKIGIIIFQNSDQGDQFEILKKIYSIAKQD